MSRLPLSTFTPVNTPDAVRSLVRYLSVIKPRERYCSKDCISAITTDALKIHFCTEAVEKGIYPMSDYAIDSVITQARKQEKAQELAKLKAEKKKLKEERKKTREVHRLDVGRKLKDKEVQKKSAIEKKKQVRQYVLTSGYTSTPITSPESLIIARDVKASNFSVVEGCIYYLCYKLESVRIPAIPSEILNNIDQTFTVKKDYSSFRKNKSELRFIFEPATDLSKFLIEATKASLSLGGSSVYIDKDVEEHGVFSLPWRYVIFREGYMFLTHPKAKGEETINPFRYDNPSIHKNYADFMPYIERHATKLLVEGHDGRITRLLNFAEFAKIFPHLTSYTSMDDGDISIERVRPVINQAYTVEEFRNARLINKSQFLAYLCKIQKPSYKIYYLLENAVHESSDSTHDEFGYLFTICESISTLTLLYENTTDQSRSSLVFNINRSDFDAAVKFIARFLASDKENKRLKLARGQVIFNRLVRSYDRISHTAYEEWRRHINLLISCRGY